MSALPALTQVEFDYATLESETRIVVQQRTRELRDEQSKLQGLFKETAESVWRTGDILRDVRDHLDHGKFLTWLDAEFHELSRTEAYRFIHVAENIKFATVANIDVGLKTLYMMAAPGTPEEARCEIEDKALLARVTSTTAAAIIAKHKQPELPPGKKWKQYDTPFYNGQKWTIATVNPSSDTFNLTSFMGGLKQPNVKASELFETYAAWKADYDAKYPPTSPEDPSPPFIAPPPFDAAGNATPHPPPAAPAKPLGITDLIKLKFIEAGIVPVRIVAHTKELEHTYSVAFNSNGTREQADGEAKTYAALIETLGYKVLNSGSDIAPGSQTLGIGGENTPMVHFANAGYVAPTHAETGSDPTSPSTTEKPADLSEETPDQPTDKIAVIPQAEMLEKYYHFTNTIPTVGASNPDGNRFEAPYLLGMYKIVVTIEPLVINTAKSTETAEV